MSALDRNGCRLSGAATAARARVFWADGRLYWATSLTDVSSAAMPNQPVRAGGGWMGTTEDGRRISISAPGCGCKKIAALVGVPQETLIVAAGASVV